MRFVLVLILLFPMLSWGQETYTFVLGGGGWPEEIALYVVDGDGNILSVLFETSGTDINLAEGCYDLVMTDSYGDGWNGNTYQVFDASGNLIQMGDLDNAAAGNGFSVGLDEICLTTSAPCTDNQLNFFVGGGLSNGEIGWSMTDESGVVVAVGTAPYASSFCLPDGCYTITMIDAFSDGWEGAVWYFAEQDGTVVDMGTLSDGAFGTMQVAIGSGSCPDPAPLSYTPQDCGGASTICSDDTFGGHSSGYGIEQDLNPFNRGCLSIEHQSSWYMFSPTSTGTIAFELDISPSTDYDFAIWGPLDNMECPPNQPPLRCSYSGQNGDTGLEVNTPEGDVSENPNGDAWVEAITVGPDDVGKMYLLLIDNYDSNQFSYDFTWNLDGVVLDCALALPIDLVSFEGESGQLGHDLFWRTESEINNSYFSIQRSLDGEHWEELAQISGQGNSSEPHNYAYRDVERPFGTSYYRLKQVDFNGDFEFSDWVALVHESPFSMGHIYPNPTSGSSKLMVSNDQETNITLEVVSVSGRRAMIQTEACANGTTVIDMDLSLLEPGMYQIIARDPNGIVLGSRAVHRR